jgi:hypothetical protein
VVWLVSHLKATCRRRTLTSQPPQWWRVPGAAEEEVSDPGHLLGAGTARRYEAVPVAVHTPMDTHRGLPRFTIMAPLT